MEANAPEFVVSAGEDRAVNVGELVTIHASCDPPPDGHLFRWRIFKPNGSQSLMAVLSNTVATFTPDMPGRYTVRVGVVNLKRNAYLTCADVQIDAREMGSHLGITAEEGTP